MLNLIFEFRFSIALLYLFATAASACEPNTVTEAYWPQLQELESQENSWLYTHVTSRNIAERAEVAAARQKPRQALYKKMIALDKAARRAQRKGQYNLMCDKTDELQSVLEELVTLMQTQMQPPEVK